MCYIIIAFSRGTGSKQVKFAINQLIKCQEILLNIYTLKINRKSVSFLTHFVSRINIFIVFLVDDGPGVSQQINFVLFLGDTLCVSSCNDTPFRHDTLLSKQHIKLEKNSQISREYRVHVVDKGLMMIQQFLNKSEQFYLYQIGYFIES